MVKERTGLYRYPEPKILAGSNYADVGFEMDAESGRVVVVVRHRQPDEGRRGYGGAVRQRDDGLGRGARPGVPGAASHLAEEMNHRGTELGIVSQRDHRGSCCRLLQGELPCDTVVISPSVRSLLMIVVKAGGGTTLDVDAIVADIASLRAKGTELLLVHGGAQTTNQVAAALGHPPEFVTARAGYVSRRTDRRTLEIFEMVYCGQLNKMWVESCSAPA